MRRVVLAFLALGVSCTSGLKRADLNKVELLFERAQKYHQNKNYEEALNLYDLVKNQHPYSRFAVQAKLGIADVQYAKQSWPEAEALYKLFKEFHPRHPELDRVTFRIGMSLWQQLPPTVDRDLSLAPEALRHFQLVKNYPKSTYTAKARKKATQVQQKLNAKAKSIAHFYFRQGEYLSAFNRYASLLQGHPSQGPFMASSASGGAREAKPAVAFLKKPEARTLYEAAVSAHRVKKYAQAQHYFQLLAKNYPKSSEKSKAEEVLNESQ